ncbi:LacI family transcriptional regulator [Peribacillus deserti]|uniref:LacI family transcriptional regulator n=1 Tax=Peribacillus deserti TaxID=673318 RepID=A0ABS2QG45_9BACI|nr:LacI family DNA-binding transcriptional regulator [Peribacillus deserti]MBM7691654.1 LacI family transcriptional regulator [Peribacillus deserti]
MKKMEINSVEIARLAGVSRSTVSRVINNYPNVPVETREKVMKIVRDFNYFPNMSAQVLAGKKMRTIGLFMIERGEISRDAISNMLMVSVIEQASIHGYYVLTHVIRDTQDIEDVTSVKEIFYQKRVDAGIFIGAANHEPLIEELIAEGFIIGVVDHHLPGRNEPNRVVFNVDYAHGAEMSVDYLVSLGHHNIGLINGDIKRYAAPAKYEGFKTAMNKHSIPIKPEWVLHANFSKDGGYRVMKKFLQSKISLPTAFIAANDSVAFGAAAALKEKGLKIPEDISVIGSDDHVLSSFFNLTTISVDFGAMMKKLTTQLIHTIEDDNPAHVKVTMGLELVERNSCKKIK